ncbi:MAG: cell division protein PerM [Jatrophihabitantaceae bacterium]
MPFERAREAVSPAAVSRPAADGSPRRSVVPTAAGRSLWLAAAWTGAGAAVLCAILGVVAVAICWLPVSGTTGRVNSTIHAGLLSFLASVHGGVTVDGTPATFLPLGMTVAVGLVAWRAGCALADAAADLGERDPARLAVAGVAQALSFALVCLLAAPLASLGTSGVPPVGVAVASLLLFALTGGSALVRLSPLSDWCAACVPSGLGSCVRAGAAAVTVYLGAGAALVAGSLAVHHGRVELLSQQVGGGWGGVPVLLLGLLAAPNAVIAGAAYLAGPGFAVGSATTASAVSTAHGTLPAFPILGAMPDGHGAGPAVWLLVVATPVAAGLVAARMAGRAPEWRVRLRELGMTAVVSGLAMAVLAWQGGGSIGSGRLRTIGASPLWLGLAVTLEVAAVAGAATGALAIWRWHTSRTAAEPEPAVSPEPAAAAEPAVSADPPGLVVVAGHGEDADKDANKDADEADELAG